jgi:hypothetical protein
LPNLENSKNSKRSQLVGIYGKNYKRNGFKWQRLGTNRQHNGKYLFTLYSMNSLILVPLPINAKWQFASDVFWSIIGKF